MYGDGGPGSEHRKTDAFGAPLGSSSDRPETFVWPAGGLFVDDYSTLPQPTSDVGRAKSDLEVFGYCYIESCLEPSKVEQLATALKANLGVDPATVERGNTPGCGVSNLQNLGPEFLELFEQ